MSILAWAAIAALVVWATLMFNRLVGLRNRARGAWSDIDVQLRRRHDLVNNLVQTVKGYVEHERRTLESVVVARARAEGARGAGSPRAAGAAETDLGGSLRSLFALVEGYPDLKASESFQELHRGLVDLENDLQNARRYYNAVVRDLNTRIQSVPDLLVARPTGFREMEFFELPEAGMAAVPRVDLTLPRPPTGAGSRMEGGETPP
jgi:LemA protein